jgi:outer membrane protein OmpA-like peptidoglycan-associated protein
VTSCSTLDPRADKTASGAGVGTAIGGGAGAIIGHQLSYSGEGLAIGAALGAVSGAVSGIGYDQLENGIIAQRQSLEQLKTQSEIVANELNQIHSALEDASAVNANPLIYHVYFDSDVTSIKLGSIADLETLAESIKKNPAAKIVHIQGHTDDTNTPEYNKRIAESRARTVASYFTGKGLPLDQIRVESYGSTRPVASNSTEEGRQLNRRVEVIVR